MIDHFSYLLEKDNQLGYYTVKVYSDETIVDQTKHNLIGALEKVKLLRQAGLSLHKDHLED